MSVASNAHAIGDFANLEGRIRQSRRGWLTALDVLNTRPLPALRPLLERTRLGAAP